MSIFTLLCENTWLESRAFNKVTYNYLEQKTNKKTKDKNYRNQVVTSYVEDVTDDRSGTESVRNSNSRAFYNILRSLDTSKGQTRTDGHSELGYQRSHKSCDVHTLQRQKDYSKDDPNTDRT